MIGALQVNALSADVLSVRLRHGLRHQSLLHVASRVLMIARTIVRETGSTMTNLPRLSLKDRGWLILAALLVTAGAFFSHHASGLAEAVMGLSLSEMSTSGDWLVPTLGGAAWSDASPLMQWMAGLLLPLTGDPILALRASGLIGLILASLFTADLAAQCGGRRCGVLAGVVLLTTFGLAGDLVAGGHLIWLTAAATAVLRLLAGIESESRHSAARAVRPVSYESLFSARSGQVLALFLLAGVVSIAADVTSLVAVMFVPIGSWLLLRRREAARKYIWLWGSLGFAAVAVAWPLAVSVRTNGTQYVWQWLEFSALTGWSPMEQTVELLKCTLPWGLLIPVGLWATRHEALGDVNSRERLIWSQALFCPIAVLIIRPQHMHDCLAAAGAWSVLAAIGLEWLINSVTLRLNLVDSDKVKAGARYAATGVSAMMAAVLVQSESRARCDVSVRDIASQVRDVSQDGAIVSISEATVPRGNRVLVTVRSTTSGESDVASWDYANRPTQLAAEPGTVTRH
jgi:4-amino-4-deoxy-L-arabinose transferase-like glycosyltransferase